MEDIRKYPGWCQEQGIDHLWRPGPFLASDPIILTRYCANCGHSQHLRPARWEDAKVAAKCIKLTDAES